MENNKRDAVEMDPATPSPSSTSVEKKPHLEDAGSPESFASFTSLPTVDASQLILSQMLRMEQVLTSSLGSSMRELRDSLAELSSNVTAIRSDMEAFGSRVEAVEREVTTLGMSLDSLSKRTDSLQLDGRRCRQEANSNKEEFSNLRARLAELEDQNRRCNLRLVGLPESTEKEDPIGFLQANLPVWFPALAVDGLIQIERAHRVYAALDSNRNKPRVLLFKLLRFIDRQAIFRAFRNAGSSITHGEAKLLLFADYSVFTSQRRKAFAPTIAALKQRSIQNFLIYPAKLKVLYQSKQLYFESPDEAMSFIKELPLP